MAKKSKKPKLAENDLLEKYFVVYEEEKDEGRLILAVGFNYRTAIRVLSKPVIRLCAYLFVEDDYKYQKRFEKLAGSQVTRSDMERWLLASLVSEADLALVTNLMMEDGSPLGVHGFPKVFAPELTNLMDEDEKNEKRFELIFQELDKVAKANPDAITQKANELLPVAVGSIKGSIYFRLRALIIQLLSDGLTKSFLQPVAPEIVKQIETGLLPSIKAELIRTRGKGKPRGSGRRYDNKAQFLRKLREAIQSLKKQKKSITQEAVSKVMHCDDRQLRAWLKEFDIKWKREK
jgi:hypothetical protein